MERALSAAGLDPTVAQAIKRQADELELRGLFLRDQAAREQWLDSPRFAEEMAAIEAERSSIRAEIGDDAYDRFLYALGRTNRVRIADVMLQSPAAAAGLQAGDTILHYGERRIFTPVDLIAETRGGTPGERVRLEVVRGGQRLEVEVPRGPLGLRIAAIQDAPDPS
jgi:C-terminal processing protease CtpA/Prc